MANLFQGSPQKATSYTTSSTETPKWMQDAIYNQVQWATNVANRPFQEYSLPRTAKLTEAQNQAYKNVVANQGFFQGDFDRGQADLYNLSSKGTAAGLGAEQNKYLSSPAQTMGMLSEGQDYLGQAGTTTAQSLAERALTAANPYLTAASGSAADVVGNYMSPYQTGVLDVIAKQGARNLQENILPNVSDAFIKAGQFGSSRMGEMGSRAMRDTQEAILNQQAQSAERGYQQALGAAQTDLARQAQLAGTVGSISGADLSRILQGGAQYGSLGQTYLGAGERQQQMGIGAAQAQAAQQAADYQRQAGILNQYLASQQQEQAMRAADVGALEAAGRAQQAQKQSELDMAYRQFMEKQLYPQQQLDFLSTQIRGMAPITPGKTTTSGSTIGATYSPSPLSQLATAYVTGKALSNLPNG